jgi:hypothetical protein
MRLLKRKRPDRPVVYCDTASKNARSVFSQMDIDLVDTSRKADLLWLRRHYRYYYTHMKRHQVLNHIPGEGRIIDKGDLTQTLRVYDATLTGSGITSADFYQESYCLYQDDDRQRFFSDKLPAADPENLWILKPGDLSKGRGIRIVWDPEQVRQVLEEPEVYGDIESDGEYIAQRYIRNPLLLNRRKSEIRVYWLVASITPLQVLMYREGTARLNTLPFRLDDFDNQLVHITNAFQQKKHPDYDPDVELKWDWKRLDTYIADDLGLAGRGVIEEKLKPALKRYLQHVSFAAREALATPPKRGNSFALFGADFILDDELKPWLTEVQLGPGLSHDDPIKAKIIPPMLSEALHIALEVNARREDGRSLASLDAVDGFEWVINEAE